MDLWDDSGQDGLARYYEAQRREERAGKELKRKDSQNREENEDFLVINSYKVETILGGERQGQTKTHENHDHLSIFRCSFHRAEIQEFLMCNMSPDFNRI